MTPLHAKLKELRDTCERATPGPWTHDWGNWDVEGPNRENICDVSATYRYCEPDKSFHSKCDPHADAEFIAQARTMLPRLIEALEKAIEQTNHYLEIVADHEPFKKDLAELDKQITEILEGE